MRPSHTILALAVIFGVISCAEQEVSQVKLSSDQRASITEEEAIAFLKQRDHGLTIDESGTLIMIAPRTEGGYDLSLMSVGASADLVETGDSLVVVALVGADLHIRIFDSEGQMVVDKSEAELVSGQELTYLKELLNEDPCPDGPDDPEYSLNKTQEIIGKAEIISGHDQMVTLEDVEAINALQNVVEIRVIAYWGIAPGVFEKFRIFPKVKIFAVHYGMPAESVRHFDRFPNVEILRIWNDVQCDLLPPLPKLRILDLETVEDELSMKCVRSIAACRNLEEINISSPISEEGAALLKSLPRLRYLSAGDTVLVDTDG